jgi:hypothetical protein
MILDINNVLSLKIEIISEQVICSLHFFAGINIVKKMVQQNKKTDANNKI